MGPIVPIVLFEHTYTKFDTNFSDTLWLRMFNSIYILHLVLYYIHVYTCTSNLSSANCIGLYFSALVTQIFVKLWFYMWILYILLLVCLDTSVNFIVLPRTFMTIVCRIFIL